MTCMHTNAAAQVQSTVAIQALQPYVKELQTKYANDKETLQVCVHGSHNGMAVRPLHPFQHHSP